MEQVQNKASDSQLRLKVRLALSLKKAEAKGQSRSKFQFSKTNVDMGDKDQLETIGTDKATDVIGDAKKMKIF